MDKDVPQGQDGRRVPPPRSAPFLRPRQPSAHFARSTVAWLLGLGVFTLALLTLVGENGIGEFLRLRQGRDDLRRDESELRLANEILQARLEALQTEPLALEKLARERYNMRRDGEEVILLVPERDESESRP